MAKKKASTTRRKAAKRKSRPVPKRAARRRQAAPRKAKTTKKATKRAKPQARRATRATKVAKKPIRAVAGDSRPAPLNRNRRQLPDSERLDSAPRVDERLVSAARSGHDELKAQLSRVTGGGPVLTAGDIDARWQDADSVGDEAPGGDNPTPDQDRVDDIGKALGIQYRDDEELKGGDEVTERDKHRWELDPASSDDWPHQD